MNDSFLTWCDQRLAACETRRASLLADQRGDEARFEQVRSNVYGIFRAVYSALGYSKALLLRRLEEISSSWVESLRQAEIHGDTDKAHIERVKLDACAEIRRFADAMEECPYD